MGLGALLLSISLAPVNSVLWLSLETVCEILDCINRNSDYNKSGDGSPLCTGEI